MDDKLSGGERKRIELASVFLMKPKLMILDEPDASLDIIVYNELYDLLLKIKDELGCSILVSLEKLTQAQFSFFPLR